MTWQVGHPLKRDGTSRRQRYPEILHPGNVPVDNRSEEDLWLFLYQLSDQFVFYNAQNEPDGNWLPFFEALKNDRPAATRETIAAFLQKAGQRNDNPVFLSILHAFFKMFSYLQTDINTLTKKHLDFYFESVLRFAKLPASPDKVHVVFELAPQLKSFLIPASTALNAGKDASGKMLTYLTRQEIIVNKAKIHSLKTIMVNAEGIYAAESADSADGMGAPQEGEMKEWPTFGHPDYMQRTSIGFAIASPLLLLREGVRTIVLWLRFSSVLTSITEEQWQRWEVYASGEEKMDRAGNKRGYSK